MKTVKEKMRITNLIKFRFKMMTKKKSGGKNMIFYSLCMFLFFCFASFIPYSYFFSFFFWRCHLSGTPSIHMCISLWLTLMACNKQVDIKPNILTVLASFLLFLPVCFSRFFFFFLLRRAHLIISSLLK